MVRFFPKHCPIEQSSPKLQIHDKISWIYFPKTGFWFIFATIIKKRQEHRHIQIPTAYINQKLKETIFYDTQSRATLLKFMNILHQTNALGIANLQTKQKKKKTVKKLNNEKDNIIRNFYVFCIIKNTKIFCGYEASRYLCNVFYKCTILI